MKPFSDFTTPRRLMAPISRHFLPVEQPEPFCCTTGLKNGSRLPLIAHFFSSVLGGFGVLVAPAFAIFVAAGAGVFATEGAGLAAVATIFVTGAVKGAMVTAGAALACCFASTLD